MRLPQIVEEGVSCSSVVIGSVLPERRRESNHSYTLCERQ